MCINTVVTNPPHSSGLVPCHFFVFPVVKEKLLGQQFSAPKDDFTAYQELLNALHDMAELVKNNCSFCAVAGKISGKDPVVGRTFQNISSDPRISASLVVESGAKTAKTAE